MSQHDQLWHTSMRGYRARGLQLVSFFSVCLWLSGNRNIESNNRWDTKNDANSFNVPQPCFNIAKWNWASKFELSECVLDCFILKHFCGTVNLSGWESASNCAGVSRPVDLTLPLCWEDVSERDNRRTVQPSDVIYARFTASETFNNLAAITCSLSLSLSLSLSRSPALTDSNLQGIFKGNFRTAQTRGSGGGVQGRNGRLKHIVIYCNKF